MGAILPGPGGASYVRYPPRPCKKSGKPKLAAIIHSINLTILVGSTYFCSTEGHARMVFCGIGQTLNFYTASTL